MNAPAMPARSLLALAEAKVPRYTSYPTAAQFGALEEAEYRAWLQRDIRPAEPLSIYVHVPFCRELCLYCACHTMPTRSARRVEAYREALLREIDLVAAAMPRNGGISHLHFGGGTPSILGGEGLRAVLERLQHHFGLRPDAEVAIELDPRLMDEKLIHALAQMGVTRASLGVQDIAPEVQARIGRPQPAELVALGVQRLREAGIQRVNLDLMYGLPSQSVAHVEASARFAASLKVARIAVFGYAHVAWMKPHQRAIDEALLPDTLQRMEQAEAAERVLTAAGYVGLGLDHFALPGDSMVAAMQAGRLRRNFQGYTTDQAKALIGLGASSIGSLPSGFAQNEAEEGTYIARIQDGHLPIRRGVVRTAEDRARAAIIERLMCDFSLNLASIDPAIRDSAMPGLAVLEQDGLIAIERGYLRVLPVGIRFVRQVSVCFDAYFQAGMQRHSAAV